MTAYQQFVDDYLDHSVDLVRIENDLASKIAGILNQLRKELTRKIFEVDPTAPDFDSLKKRRLQVLINQATRTIKSSVKSAEKEYSGYLYDFSKVEAKANVEIPNQILGASVLSTALTPTQLKEIVKDTLIQGAPSAQWWERMGANAANRFADQVRMGMISGEPLNSIVQRIRGKSTGKYKSYIDASGKRKRWMEFKGGIMDVTTREAESLARTSIQTVANEVRIQTIKANADVCNGWEWLSTLDNRTTPICRALDGERWDLDFNPVDGGPRYPGACPHWGCRSTLVPWLKSLSELTQGELKDFPEGKRAVMPDTWGTEQASARTGYKAWFDKQPKYRKLEILGPGKLKIYEKHGLSFRDMVTGSGRPLTIAELEKKVSRPKFKSKG